MPTPSLISQALWLGAPVLAGGLIHITVIRTGAFSALARLPLDAGRTFRQRRIFGANKTWRGALVTILATIACTFVQATLVARFPWARDLTLIDFRQISPLAWGSLLGLGYVVGELPNSFLKRQLDVPPGASASGVLGPLFWCFDQIDSVVGILIFLCAVWIPPLPIALTLLAITLVIHPAASLLMYGLKLKTRIG